MAPRDANWVDGLRGVASFMVVMGHLCTAFAPWLHQPAKDPNTPPHPFQLPFLRLVVGGRAAVAIFFLITGYVNSIGPIGRSRAGNVDGAFTGIARSALARSGRLILPTAIATTITWFIAQINGYHMTRHVDATWIRQGWHGQSPSFFAALKSLAKAQVETWTTGWNEYDGTQWTLHLFLEGSMLVYCTMTALVLVRPRARYLIYFIMYWYFWVQDVSTGAIKGMNIVMGMFVAELQHEFKDSATTLLPTPVPSLMIICGMFMAGYPMDSHQNARWSHIMKNIMSPLVKEHADVRRYWDHLAAASVLLGVFFSRNGRRVLTSPVFNFLGRVSFPVYLTHNTFMKTVLVWMVYFPAALNPKRNDKGEMIDLRRGSKTHMAISLVIFYYILYKCASLWVAHIDPWCGKITNMATKWAYGDSQSRTTPTHNGGPILRRASGEREKPPAASASSSV